MFRRFLLSRIWSSAQDHVVLVLLLNIVGFFISTWPRWSVGNILYRSCISFEGASRGGQLLNIFTWFIGAGGKASPYTPFVPWILAPNWSRHTVSYSFKFISLSHLSESAHNKKVPKKTPNGRIFCTDIELVIYNIGGRAYLAPETGSSYNILATGMQDIKQCVAVWCRDTKIL